ncbi:hypothetical protein [Planctomicrobium piriforme]|uniref:Neutral/alkaline non-lysosomal ceramidase, N-terminal n=1 Tax=Planctomicrobium piriforme TaxID=1576369 RepID=A0A1I3H1K2_9PLAN|nr:hypothetical protein [Planctomicrobium piriforme]SFI29496.1 hypothetical protein SAMN05421753_107212 [Planctomicrobium piriforme]
MLLMFRLQRCFVVFTLCISCVHPTQAAEPTGLKIATFNVNATPPIGSPAAYAPTRSVEEPLYARGIVLLGAGKPIVLCAVDWLGIGNDGQTLWREKLAEGAGTTTDRVAVHTLHQHDAPRCDFRADEILAEKGLGGARFDSPFCRDVIERTAQAIRTAVPHATPVTHLGVGKAKVEKVASNRRILGPDGKVAISRMSKTKNPAFQAAPEGLIDPELKLISFWNGEQPIASLTYYATHPMSYYGTGDLTSDFIGLAREQRVKALPEIAHIHFNGAGGNVAAGKYNDGSPEARIQLTDRVEQGMKAAWEATVRTPITVADVDWRTTIVRLPLPDYLSIESERAKLEKETVKDNRTFAPIIAWVERSENGVVPVELSCLQLKNVAILHMPGELFIEFQLAAQAMRPDETVCMAAYGEYGTGYIGTEIAYSQGGYETDRDSSHVSPAVEKVLTDGMRTLLGK